MKRTFIVCCAVAFSLALQAQLLWEISGNQLQAKSYLFGSHHLVPITFLDSVAGIYPAFNSCKNVVGEIILDDLSVVQKMQQAAVITSGRTTKDLLTAEQYAVCDSVLTSTLGMGLAQLQFFKPAMVENIYVLTVYEKYFPKDEDFQVDTYFQKVGKKSGKRLFSLETVEEQIRLLLDSKTLEEQAASLYKTLTSTEYIVEQVKQLNACYLKQDLECLLAMSNADSMMSADERWAMIDARNLRWAEQLPAQLEKGGNFIVVGALHLAGDNGLIALLRKQGYKVKPVK